MTVQCSEYKDCGNQDCMHCKPHEPIEYEIGDCTSAATICPLVSYHDVICQPVVFEVNEDYEAMVADIGIKLVAVPA